MQFAHQQHFIITTHSTRTKTQLHINMIVTLIFWFKFFKLGKNWWKTDDRSDEVNEGTLCAEIMCTQTPNWVEHDYRWQHTIQLYGIVLQTCTSIIKQSGCTLPVHGTVWYTSKIRVTKIKHHHTSMKFINSISSSPLTQQEQKHSCISIWLLHLHSDSIFFELGKNWWKTDDRSNEVNEGTLCAEIMCIQIGWNTTVYNSTA